MTIALNKDDRYRNYFTYRMTTALSVILVIRCGLVVNYAAVKRSIVPLVGAQHLISAWITGQSGTLDPLWLTDDVARAGCLSALSQVLKEPLGSAASWPHLPA